MSRRRNNYKSTLFGKPGRLFTAALLAMLVSTLVSGVALAHAAFVRSQPAPNSVLTDPPSAVTIWFTEDVDPVLSEIAVLDAVGKRVNPESTTVLPGDPKAITVSLPRLPDGIYTVAWKAFSGVDGHTLSGSFVFAIGVPLPAAQAPVIPTAGPTQPEPFIQSPIEVVMRWLALLSILAIMGCLVFDVFITRHFLGGDRVGDDMRNMNRRMEYRTLNFIFMAAGVFTVAAIGELLVRASAATGVPIFATFGRPAASLLQTDWGNLWVWRMAGILGLIVVLALAARDRKKNRLSGGREWGMVAAAFSALVIFAVCMASHGAAIREIRAAAVFSDYLHMLAASVWIGGLFYMAIVIPPVMKAQREATESKQFNHSRTANSDLFCPASHVKAIGRFSTLAMLSVGTLFITGLYNSWMQVTTLPALATPYGKMLLVKLGLVAPMVLLGAVNMLWVKPRLAHDGAALRVLRKASAAEAILAILLVLSVGILITMEPARQAFSRQSQIQANRLTLQSSSEGVNFKTLIEPGNLGPNLVTVFLTDRTGRPIENATRVTLQLDYLDGDLAPFSEDTLNHGFGIWVAHQASFSVAGNWQASLTVQRPDGFDARTSYRLKIPISTKSSTIELTPEAGERLWGVELALLGVLFGGIGIYTGRKTQPGLAGIAVGGVAFVAGIILIVSTLG